MQYPQSTGEHMIRKHIKAEKTIAFLLGLLVSEGVSSAFSFGSTTFTLAEVLSPVFLFILCLRNPQGLSSFIRCVPLGFKLFFLAVILSIISGLAYFFSIEILYRYAVGVIYLLIILTTAIDVFLLRNLHGDICKGLLVGLLANAAFSLVCYIAFQRGIVITLREEVGRAAFFAPKSTFRSQGFFLEPSHFIRYVGTVVLIVLSSVRIRHSLVRYAIIAAAGASFILSYSGSLVILAAGLFIYWVGTINANGGNRAKARPVTLLIVFAVLIFGILNMDGAAINNVFDFRETADRIMNNADITDVGNAERYESMRAVLNHLLRHPDLAILGCGWNLTSTLIRYEHLGITAAFSDVLELFLETGVIGGMLYACSLLLMSVRLWRLKSNYARALSATLMIIFALQIGTDYALNTGIMLVFGLAVGELAG